MHPLEHRYVAARMSQRLRVDEPGLHMQVTQRHLSDFKEQLGNRSLEHSDEQQTV